MRGVSFSPFLFAAVAGSCFFAAPRAQGQYVLLTGSPDNGIVTLWNVNRDGTMSFRSSFDTWTSTTYFADMRDINFSKTGQYVFMQDADGYEGVIYRVTMEDCGFHFLKEFTDGCGGGGFSPDETSFFTYTHVSPSQGAPIMEAYSVAGDQISKASSLEVPSTAGLMFRYFVNDTQEVIGAGYDGWRDALNAFIVYQCSPTSLTLSLKQYVPNIKMLWSDINTTGDMVVYGRGSSFGVMLRDTDGEWEQHWTFPNPFLSSMSWGVASVAFTPDCRYVISGFGSDWGMENDGGGMAVFRVNSDKTLSMVSHLPRRAILDTAMTPDGRYVVARYYGGDIYQKFGVFRFNPKTASFTEVFTMDQYGYIKGMAFMPQAFPPAKAKPAWNSYSMKNPDSMKKPTGAPPPSSMVSQSAPSPPPALDSQTTRSLALRARRAPDGGASPGRTLSVSR